MLIKKELETIPLWEPPSVPPTKAKHRDKCDVHIVELPRSGKVLVLDLYNVNRDDLTLRFFSDAIGSIYATSWPPTSESWHRGKPADDWYDFGNCYSSSESDKLVKGFLGKYNWHNDAYGMVNDFVSQRYADKRERAHETKQALWEKHQSMFPKHPKGLDAYCEKYVFPVTYIFISKKHKGQREAICGRCGHIYTADVHAKSGDACSCPKCKSKAEYRGNWMGPPKTEKAKICIAHKVKGQLLLRWAEVARDFPLGGRFVPKYSYSDYCYNLHLHNGGKQIVYCYKWQPVMCWGYDWIRKRNGDVNWERTYIYTGNLKAVFGNAYRVDLAVGLKGKKIDMMRLLNNLRDLPAAEYLFKMGLPTLASEIDSECISGGMGFAGILGVSKQYLSMYRKYDPNLNEHLLVKAVEPAWVSEEAFLKIRELDIHTYNIKDIRALLRAMSFSRFVNYFHKQHRLLNLKFGDLYQYYRDYIAMSVELKVDLSTKSVRFPANIKVAHDQLVERANAVRQRKANAKFKRMAKKLNATLPDYHDDDYCIIKPAEAAEIIAEGQALRHCVGSKYYIDRHMEGKRIILFVRHADEPNTPYFTMELDVINMQIIQLRGKANCDPPKKVKTFADRFIKAIKKPVHKAPARKAG